MSPDKRKMQQKATKEEKTPRNKENNEKTERDDKTRGNATPEEEIISVASDWGPIVHKKPVFSMDSKYLVVVSGPAVKVLSTESGKLVEEHLHHKHNVVGVVRAEEEKDAYVSCDEAGLVCFWKLHSKKKDDVKKYALRLKKEEYEVKVSSFEFCRKTRELFVVVTNGKWIGALFKFSAPYDHKKARQKLVQRYVQLGQGRIALSSTGRTLAVCTDKRLIFLQNRGRIDISVEKKGWTSHLVREDLVPTCAAYHPSKDIVAVGDTMGRIMLWYEGTTCLPRQVRLHWHESPVGCLAFSRTGNELYSGGSECVMVKWELSSEQRRFLPRLGMPFKHITTDETNTLIAVAHIDNGISIVDSQSYTLTGVVQGFSMNTDNLEPFSAGIVYDPRTRAIVTNSKTGHVQFYDLGQSRLLYHVHITLSNFYTQEQYQKINNTEVERVAMSPDGYRMATTEYRPDSEYNPEIRLRFWQFKKFKQEWFLNTSIDLPHQKPVNALAFQRAADNSLFCVTCSDDGKFKIWEEIDTSDKHCNKSSWSCVNVGFYRHLPAAALSISSDASLLAVGFSSIVTLWEPSMCQFKGSLSQSYLSETILQIEFGRGEGCRSLLVTRSCEWLCVWNLLTCSLQWRVSIRSTCLAADPLSQYMAVFSEKGDLFIFDPRRSKVVSVQEKVTQLGKPLAAAFIPRVQRSDQASFWNYNSSLHYISSDQTLHTLEVVRDLNSAKEKIGEEVRQLVLDTDGPAPALTPFAALLAPVRTSHTAEAKEKEAGSAEFGVKIEKSTLFIQKVLDEARIYKLDSFSHLASAFCKMVLPEAETSEERLQQEEVKSKTQKEEMVMTSKKIKKTELRKVAEIDFTDLMESLAL